MLWIIPDIGHLQKLAQVQLTLFILIAVAEILVRMHEINQDRIRTYRLEDISKINI